MAIGHAQIALTDAAAESLNSVDTSHTHGTVGQTILVQNPGTPNTETVMLGASDVTTAAYGHILDPGGSVAIAVAVGETLYAVASGAVTVNVLYQGV